MAWIDLAAGILEEFAERQRAVSQDVDRALSVRFVSDLGGTREQPRGRDGLTDRQRASHAQMSVEMRELWARRRR